MFESFYPHTDHTSPSLEPAWCMPRPAVVQTVQDDELYDLIAPAMVILQRCAGTFYGSVNLYQCLPTHQTRFPVDIQVMHLNGSV